MSPIFEALADPTRHRILALLRDGERPVGELVDTLGVAQPSISKHLSRLKAAGLVDLRADAQRRFYRLTPQPLHELEGWLSPYLRPQPAAGAAVEVERSDGPRGWSLGFEIVVPAAAETVWAAITEPSRLQAWLGKATIEPGADGRFRVQFPGPGTVMAGRSIVWDAPRKLELRWRINPKAEGPGTRTIFELTEQPGGVKLALTQRGLTADLIDEVASLWLAHLAKLPAACL